MNMVGDLKNSVFAEGFEYPSLCEQPHAGDHTALLIYV